MTRAAMLRSWLVTPPLRGLWVVAWTAVALPVAAFLDWTMHCANVLGECCTPFFMLILFTAVLFGWRVGVVTTLASAIVSLWVDSIGPMQVHAWGGDLLQTAVFLGVNGAIVLGVELIRRALARFSRLSSRDEHPSGIVFSLEKGEAWASWPGHPAPVRLGPEQEVAAMMEDFLAQNELARRLERFNGMARSSAPAAGA